MSHHRVKHPCKICSQSVSNKTGLQCKGACRKWAHFKCLNYSASKIECIKAGELKIICPCPNCNTGEANLPKSSSSVEKASSNKCRPNAKPCCPLPCCPLSPASSTSPRNSQQQLQSPPSHQRPDSPRSSPKQCQPCPKKCSRYPLCSLGPTSSTSLHKRSASPPCLPKQSSPPPTPPKPPVSPLKWPRPPPLPLKRPVSPPSPPKRPVSPPSPPKRPVSPPSPPKQTISPPCLPKCAASRPHPAEPYPVPPTPAPTAAPPEAVTGDFKHVMRKTKSCSCGVCKQDEIVETSLTVCKSESDTLLSKSKENQQKLYCTIEQLCNTVGLLSTQIKDLVGRLVSGND